MNFNHKAKRFSKVNLAYLAHCSNIVYEKKTHIARELTKLGFDISRDNYFFSDSVTHTQAMVTGDRQKIIVSFRGTEGKFKDWLTDARVLKEVWTRKKPVGEVHNGFHKALKSVWPDVSKEINTLRDNNQSIWITGHSLGGALATLAAATLELQSPRTGIGGVYTFGQPRIANQKFSRAYNHKLKPVTFRCVNNNDVVSRIPPQIFGYSHVGSLMYFDNDGKLHRDGSLSWWAKFWDRLEGRYDNVFDLKPDGVKDHSMDTYQRLSKRTLR